MTLRILPATFRDLSYIAANLRPEDRAEIDCQLDHWSPALLVLRRCQGFAYVAELDGNPEARVRRRRTARRAVDRLELGHAPDEALRAWDHGTLSHRAWAPSLRCGAWRSRRGRWPPMNWRGAGLAGWAPRSAACCRAMAGTAKIFSSTTGQEKAEPCVCLQKPPELKPLPPAPTVQDKDVQAREAALRAELEQRQGTLSTIKTDLAPGSLTGQRRVLLGL